MVAGRASIVQTGNVTTVQQSSNKAIINWQGFSIANGETVNFNQPGSYSATLNRVIGNNPSVIAGVLHANGQVFIVNSAGVVFNSSAQVNVGGLVASTLDISNHNFMSGKYTFEGNSTAPIVNQGSIMAHGGGYVALLGHSVSNQGTISATLGTVAMASGQKITLNFEGNSLIDVTVKKGAYDALVENKGLIKANGGRVIMTAKAADALLSAQVNNSGIIQAHSMSALMGGHGGGGFGYGRSHRYAYGGHSAGHHGHVHIGRIQFVSRRTTSHSASARLAASRYARAQTGTKTYTGSITLLAQGGTVTNSGTLDASAPKTGNGGTVKVIGDNVNVSGTVNASSANGTGGTIIVTGTNVALTGTAALNAGGAAGGTILVGGDVHGGADASANFVPIAVADATTTTIMAGATLTANGSNGNGGNIVVWSNSETNFAGTISATGAGASGNGGFAEVSSHNLLDFTGSVNLVSTHGTTGTLLLDPYNVIISNDPDSGGASLVGNYPTADSVINITTLVAALARANVTISTGGGQGNEQGNITIEDALSWSTPHTLTLSAANEIDIDAAISWGAGGGFIATTLGNAGVSALQTGNINVNATIMWTGGTLSLNAAQNLFVNAALTASGGGVSILKAGGDIDINAASALGTTATVTASGDINVSAALSLGTSTTLKATNNVNLYVAPVAPAAGGTLALKAGQDVNFYVPMDVSKYILTATAGGNINVDAAITFAANNLSLNATNNINLNAAPMATGSGASLTLNAGEDVNFNTAVDTSNYTLTATAGQNINVNAPLSWSQNTLTLNAVASIYVNAVMTATNTAALAISYGNGTNADGTPNGLYVNVDQTGGYTGSIDFSNSAGNVYINNQKYQVLNAANLALIGSNPNGSYVLGSNIDGLSMATLQSLGFFTPGGSIANFNGFGHSLTTSSTASLTIGTDLSIISLPNTNLTIKSGGDIDVEAPITSSAGILTLLPAGNLILNAPITATGGQASLVFGGSQIILGNTVSASTEWDTSGWNIYVKAPVNWSSDTKLSFVAAQDLYIDGAVTGTGTNALLFLQAGNNIYINAPIAETGTGSYLSLNYGGNYFIDVANGASVTLNENSAFWVNGNHYTLISTAADLIGFLNTTDPSINYAIVSNIDMSGVTLTAENSGSLILESTLAGLGHTIENLTIVANGNAALLNTIDLNGSVRDLGITVAYISATNNAYVRAAALALTNNGSIFDSFVTGADASASINSTATDQSLNTGGPATASGLVDQNTGTISNSYVSNLTLNADGNASYGYGLMAGNSGTVDHVYVDNVAINLAGTGVGSAAGLIGENSGLFTNSSGTNISIVANNGASHIGAAVGDNSGTIDSVTVSGNITLFGGGYFIGGFAGTNSGAISNSQSYVNIVVTGAGNYIGGFVGSNSGTIINSYAYGTIYAPNSQYIGSFAGALGGGAIKGSSSKVVCIIHTCAPYDQVTTGAYTPPPPLQPPTAPPAPPPNPNNPAPIEPQGPSPTPPPNPNVGLNTGTGISTIQSSGSTTPSTAGTSAVSRAASAASGGQASAAASAPNGANTSDTGAPAGTQTAGLTVPDNVDLNITGRIPDATTPPPASHERNKERKERKQAINTPKPKPQTNYGAHIQSIEINGQKFDTESPGDKAPKNADEPKPADAKPADLKPDAPSGNTSAPSAEEPKTNAPAAPADPIPAR